MTRTLLTMLALAGLAACGGGGDREDLATADSLSRDLQLAPVDTSAELNDQPAPDTAAAPAPAPAKPDIVFDYEEAARPDLAIRTDVYDAHAAAERVLSMIRQLAEGIRT
jgi:hypothetical protein